MRSGLESPPVGGDVPALPRPSPDPVAVAALLGAGAMLGLTATLSKLAADAGLSPLAFLVWPVFGAAVVLRAVDRQPRRPVDRPLVRYLLVAGLITVAVPQLILFSAVSQVGAAFVALAVAFPPIFTYLGAVAFGREPLRVDRSIGVVSVVIGAVLLAVSKLTEPDAPTLWIGLTLTVPVLLAIGNLFRSWRWPAGRSGSELAPGMLFVAGSMLLPAAAAPGLDLAVPAEPRAVVLVGTQTLVFVAQYALFFVVQRRGGPVFLSLLGSVGAMVGASAAAVVLDESLPGGLLPAAVCIAMGMRQLTKP